MFNLYYNTFFHFLKEDFKKIYRKNLILWDISETANESLSR